MVGGRPELNNKDTPVLVCRVAWMKYYQGLTEIDPPYGGGEFVDQNGYGHEVFNFASHRGKHYGYVRAPGGNNSIAIERLGAQIRDDSIDGVAVFWAATDPNIGGVYIVGWYPRARVFRRNIVPSGPVARARTILNLPEPAICSYQIESYDVTGACLPVETRSFRVPTREGGMGRAPIWYPDHEQSIQLLALLSTEASVRRSRRRGRVGFQSDIEKRNRIEKEAQVAVEELYRAEGYDVVDVSNENHGWDIEADLGIEHLRIEVKGRSMESIDADLTPNEYRAMLSDSLTYRLCIVTMALDPEARQIHEFAWNPGLREWRDQEERTLSVEVIKAARVGA